MTDRPATDKATKTPSPHDATVVDAGTGGKPWPAHAARRKIGPVRGDYDDAYYAHMAEQMMWGKDD